MVSGEGWGVGGGGEGCEEGVIGKDRGMKGEG